MVNSCTGAESHKVSFELCVLRAGDTAISQWEREASSLLGFGSLLKICGVDPFSDLALSSVADYLLDPLTGD